MVWSFLWRAVVYGAAVAALFTWVVGFVMGLFGSSMEAIHDAGRVAQVVGAALGVASAYLNAKDVKAS